MEKSPDLTPSMEKMSLSSPSPSSTMEQKESKGFCELNYDLLQNLLSRLPATSFAYAACVCKAWNAACSGILSRPKLSCATSLNPSRSVALQEAFHKVLSKPIRPHFAIACVGPHEPVFKEVLAFMVEKLGSRTPILLYSACGIIGRDALTDEFKEADKEPMYGKFAMDIKSYTSSVSGSTSPLAIILIGDHSVDLKPILEILDYAMPRETVIVGDESTSFVYRSGDNSRNDSSSPKHSPGAVALVFARDRDKAHGIGEIEFHFALSNGVSVIGPRFKAASVEKGMILTNHTCLTATREGQQGILGGRDMLDEIDDERAAGVDLYIGVTRRWNCSLGSDMPRMVISLGLHEVLGGDEEFLSVEGDGIAIDDYFQFYRPDPEIALQSCREISLAFRNLKLDWNSKKEAVGGFMFSSYYRGENPFFEELNVDSAPLLENFPVVSLAGTINVGEIGRGYAYPNLTVIEDQNETSVRGHLHVYSTVYLVLSYSPPPT